MRCIRKGFMPFAEFTNFPLIPVWLKQERGKEGPVESGSAGYEGDREGGSSFHGESVQRWR